MADIFLSYAREDLEHARRIAEALEAAGWSVFWDRRIRPGQQFDEVIERHLDDCRVVVVLWSTYSVRSEWVKNEAAHGREREPSALIPARIAAVDPPFAFRRIQAADLTAWVVDNPSNGASALEELFTAIDEIAPRSAAPRETARPTRTPVSPKTDWQPPPRPVTPVKTGAPTAPASSAKEPEVSPPPASPSPAGAPAVRERAKTPIAAEPPREIVVPLNPPLVLVRVPAGPFQMGSGLLDHWKAVDDEMWPDGRGKLNLPEFYIGKYPVTVAQFRACVTAQGITPSHPRTLGPHGEHPVVYVSWHEALQYCRWLDHAVQEFRASTEVAALLKPGWHVSLPSEAEWEKAARGTDGRTYPWGEGIDPTRANYSASKLGTTSPVGSFSRGASPYGAQDMSGNVWEWTRSLLKPYPYDPGDGREDLTKDGHRVVRGGSFFNDVSTLRVACRNDDDPGLQNYYLGFRVVVSRF
jgi:formylglycine-generating enzyme required for sulfatase activity